MDGGRGNASKRAIISGMEVASRVKGDHVSRPNDDEFDDLPEGDILGLPDGLGVAASECTGFGDGHGIHALKKRAWGRVGK